MTTPGERRRDRDHKLATCRYSPRNPQRWKNLMQDPQNFFHPHACQSSPSCCSERMRENCTDRLLRCSHRLVLLPGNQDFGLVGLRYISSSLQSQSPSFPLLISLELCTPSSARFPFFPPSEITYKFRSAPLASPKYLPVGHPSAKHLRKWTWKTFSNLS